PKYVLHGYTDLPEVALITGDNYERAVVGDRLQAQRLPFMGDFLNLFVFNVEKIFDNPTEQRRFHAFNETLGGNLADLLAAQPDLVLLMDESHRYRATASMAAMNALKPVLGLEFTATPAGKNVIYRYDLGQAIRDALAHLDDPDQPSGYIKVPVVLGRRDMHVTGDAFERVQLQDGIARHRQKKTLVEAYCRNHDLPVILPITLISTKNIAHANEIRDYVESDDFFGGEYRGKTVVTHSKTGDLREADIAGLLQLESPENDKEIVIHVNKLREGWDVKNVYTIIPLRAAKSDVLTEQTIGRGMRLPFGVQTGDEDLDTLEIAAHDHFAAIVSEAHTAASRTGVPIRTREITDKDKAATEVQTVEPDAASPYWIAVPRLAPVSAAIQTAATLEDFTPQPRRAFDAVDAKLVGTVIGDTAQRIFDVPPYAMSEDPLRYLTRVVFAKCASISADDADDRRLIPEIVARYLAAVNADTTSWRTVVQVHAAEMVADLAEQIEEHVDAQTTIAWEDTGETVAWKTWTKSVIAGTAPESCVAVPDDACTKKLLAGYTHTCYALNTFDSKQEKWLADILDHEPRVRSWVRVPVGSFPISYGVNDYNPDFIVETDELSYLIEVKKESELTSVEVQRKADAARDWCAAASQFGDERWEYVLLSHADMQRTDSFAGVLAKAFALPEPPAARQEPCESPATQTRIPGIE
ncbi:MAG TPA: hypothetical protein VFZ25_09515, partial [Chloroflexota bacterium]|nr:hypothetical protein [Chloroflexota bacterium]